MFIGVLSTVVSGSYLSINKSFEGENNIVFLSNAVEKMTTAVMAIKFTPVPVLEIKNTTDEVLCIPMFDKKFNDTGSLVDFLNANSIDYSLTNRIVIANRYGIKNYQGTKEQNIHFLNLLKNSEACK